jgi:2-dehydro-3-deoxy-D-arabinonate dehydratase
MKLIQFYHPSAGRHLGVLEEGKVFDLTAAVPEYDSFLSLIRATGGEAETLAAAALMTVDKVPAEATYAWEDINQAQEGGRAYLLIPIEPPEVWGFGVTYKRSAEVRDADVAKTMDSSASIYDRVYYSDRPECFFKATAPRCVGPYGEIGIRSDSQLTATEPELAYVLGRDREIVGYTICNDVSAWDLERDNPLYLPQSKIFRGCCALGPAITLASGGPDPYALDIRCRILRGGETIYDEHTSSGNIGRRFEELNEYLYRDNPVPAGAVISTGTGIMAPNEMALKDGDVVEIEIEGIGVLSNTARKLKG